MKSKKVWTQEEVDILIQCVEESSTRTKGYEKAAKKLNRTLEGCRDKFLRLPIKKHIKRNYQLFDTKEAVKCFRKYIKLYAGNLNKQAFPEIAKKLGVSTSYVNNAYYGIYGNVKCNKNNLGPSFCLLCKSNTFNKKNFNRDSFTKNHTKKSVYELIKKIFSFK